VRIAQFFTGGWIDNHLSTTRNYQSNSYFFPSDIAPTLLEMAGGNSNFLLEGKTGASYGNPMWEYIKNSVDPTKGQETHQKVRKVSYSPTVYFDVQADRTMKNFFTGKTPQYIPRLWAPVWPTNDDLVSDIQYYSVNPCRPGGKPSDCCYLNIEDDPIESNPLPADCNAMHQEGKELFVIDADCDDKNQTNNMCVTRDKVKVGVNPQRLSLWSHYRAIGPFVNSKAQPIDGLPMKCICNFIDSDISQADVDYFTPATLVYSQCFSSSKFKTDLRRAVPCDGSFSSTPQTGMFQALEAQGIDTEVYKTVRSAEFGRVLPLVAPEAGILANSYISREGFTEWPNFGTFLSCLFLYPPKKFPTISFRSFVTVDTLLTLFFHMFLLREISFHCCWNRFMPAEGYRPSSLASTIGYPIFIQCPKPDIGIRRNSSP
jgi:hypothetical protein